MENRHFKLKEIAEVLNSEIFGKGDYEVASFSIDSRSSLNTEHSLFFALKTSKDDGHKYIPDLYKKGVRCFVVEQLPDTIFENASYVKVDNTLKSLQLLAKYKRNKSDAKIIAISGSNGKTIVKEWLFDCLKSDYSILRSPKSYNSQIGVALSLWSLEAIHSLAIIEVGISKPDEMQQLENIVRPDIGIFTNIGSAHSENFASLSEKVQEKLKLFKNVSKLIYKADPVIEDQITKSSFLSNTKKISWGSDEKHSFRIVDVKKFRKQSEIKAIYKNREIVIKCPFADDASIENSISVSVYLLEDGYSAEEINRRLAHLRKLEMRLEQIEAENNCTLINDGYSLDIDSLKIALDYLNTQFKHSKRTAILSDIEQTSLTGIELYQSVATQLNQHKVSKAVLIGEEISKYASLFKNTEVYTFSSTNNFINSKIHSEFKDEVILIKGARSFKFENIVDLFSKQNHDTILEVNLSHLENNLNYFKSHLKKETRLMVMVKALSYGAGSSEIANFLQFHNVDYLAVAYADEGKALRKEGINTPILVLNPETSTFKTLIKYNLEPEVYSMRLLKAFAKALDGLEFNIHIKIDSGMHRLGFEYEETEELIGFLSNNNNLHVSSIFSHLVASEDKSQSEYTKKQVDIFKKAADKITTELNIKPLLHILNSAGVLNYPQYQFNMVRVGLGLHGLNNDPYHSKHLKAISSLKSIITQIKHLKKGESVGYNRRFIAEKDMKTATIAVGYADGVDRRWGNELGVVYCAGKKCRIIGTIAMDMMMIDVSDVDCHEGQVVEIFGENISVNTIAEKIGTIPYEILTKVSPRVKRVFFRE